MPGNLTAHQAQQALGRPLTWLEQEWVTKTMGWKDYELYCLTFFILVIGYCVGSAPFLTLDFLRIPFFEKYRLQPTYRNSYSAVVDCLRSVLGDMFMVILPLNLTSFPFFSVAGINGGIPLPTLPEMALQLATFFIVEDFGNYWIHRWLHTEWAYKTIHWKHHEFTTPMSFAASYAHPLEILILGIPSFVGPAIVRCHVITLWAWIVLRQWEAVETHSGYHFPWSPTGSSPSMAGLSITTTTISWSAKAGAISPPSSLGATTFTARTRVTDIERTLNFVKQPQKSRLELQQDWGTVS